MSGFRQARHPTVVGFVPASFMPLISQMHFIEIRPGSHWNPTCKSLGFTPEVTAIQFGIHWDRARTPSTCGHVRFRQHKGRQCFRASVAYGLRGLVAGLRCRDAAHVCHMPLPPRLKAVAFAWGLSRHAAHPPVEKHSSAYSLLEERQGERSRERVLLPRTAFDVNQ